MWSTGFKPKHTHFPLLSSFYTELTIQKTDLTALLFFCMAQIIKSQVPPLSSAQELGLTAAPQGSITPCTKQRQKYSSTRAFAMDENW